LVVSGATILNFSGATITSGGTGQANITITAEGGLVNGTGTSSLKQKNGLTTTNATASGTNSIAIGNAAGASGTGTISIGTGSVSGSNTIGIGNNINSIGNAGVGIGSALYANGQFSIQIGNDLAASTGSVVIGATSRATGTNSITIGSSNDQNIGVESSILGYNNQISNRTFASVLYDLGGSYNNIFASNSFIGFRTTNRNYNSILGGDSNIIISSGNSNTIIGGVSNTISGTTSGATLISMSNYIPTRNNAAFAMAYVMTNYASYNFLDDTAAAAGGVVLGQMYHNAGALRIRIV
jgi:hypothetical protein